MKVFLVGAAYVSREAAKESAEVIRSTQPRVVLLELDEVAQLSSPYPTLMVAHAA